MKGAAGKDGTRGDRPSHSQKKVLGMDTAHRCEMYVERTVKIPNAQTLSAAPPPITF
jgi:hypothetical protein